MQSKPLTFDEFTANSYADWQSRFLHASKGRSPEEYARKVDADVTIGALYSGDQSGSAFRFGEGYLSHNLREPRLAFSLAAAEVLNHTHGDFLAEGYEGGCIGLKSLAEFEQVAQWCDASSSLFNRSMCFAETTDWVFSNPSAMDRVAIDPFLHFASLAEVPLAWWVARIESHHRTAVIDLRLLHDCGASRGLQLGMGLCHFLEQFRQGEALGLSLNKVIETSLIRYVASSELFLTVATKSAFEILLSQICGELGLGKWPPLMWLGDVDTSSFSIFSPETNILRSTTAVMGLCLSGVDWVTVPEYRIQTNPIESDEVLRKQIADTRRAARAQFLLLKNEARAVTPEHPMQGAWFAEHLVAELVEAGASWLRKIESQGGLIAALANGWIEAMVQEQFEVKNQKLLTSESKLVGVNCFLDEGQDFKKIHSSLTESLSLFAQGSRKDLKARRNPFVIEESVVAKAGAK